MYLNHEAPSGDDFYCTADRVECGTVGARDGFFYTCLTVSYGGDTDTPGRINYLIGKAKDRRDAAQAGADVLENTLVGLRRWIVSMDT